MREAEIIFAVEESAEGGYELTPRATPSFLGGDSIQELKEMVGDAVGCRVYEAQMPAIIRLPFVPR